MTSENAPQKGRKMTFNLYAHFMRTDQVTAHKSAGVFYAHSGGCLTTHPPRSAHKNPKTAGISVLRANRTIPNCAERKAA